MAIYAAFGAKYTITILLIIYTQPRHVQISVHTV